MQFSGRSIVSLRDFDRQQILYVLEKAREVKQGRHAGCLAGKVLATLFYEPSTRTRLSFESAMISMGGSAIGFADPGASSVKKGESLYDTIRTVEGYADVIVIRHSVEGSARLASEAASIPVINAGDGANQHPTQTFLDLFTIMEECGSLDGIRIGLLGDLRFGRTVHSLTYALSMFGATLYFISPPTLRMPAHILDDLKLAGHGFHESEDVLDFGRELDVVYVTRIQKERFADFEEYTKVAQSYRLTARSVAERLGPRTRIMHPLPRVGEIATDVDGLPNAIYFRQAHNGIPTRQALLGLVTGAIQ